MYVGIDAHKRECHATVLNERGEVVSRTRFPTNLGALATWAKSLPTGSVLALEASTVAKRLYWHLKKLGLDVRMAHPLAVRRKAGMKKKTDALDSFELADLLRMGRLPESYVPSPGENERRQLLRFRIDLGRKINVIKCQIHALLTHNGIEIELTDIFGAEGRRRIEASRLSATQRYLLDGLLCQLDLMRRQVDEVQGELARRAETDPAVRRLMTMPGVDYYSAQVILTEIGDVTRFPSSKHLASYAGLVPRVMQSGAVSRTGHIHKEGPRALRWILTVCAHSAIKSPGKFQNLYRRLQRRIGTGKAIVAVAHRLVEVVFVLLTRGESYSQESRRNLSSKLWRMRARIRALPTADVSARLQEMEGRTPQWLRTVAG